VSKEKLHFRRVVVNSGLSRKIAEELWKWYNPAEKKGIARF